jgi:hypothetical protein
MSYMRVVPRDLFNESKLLKCLGHLSLAIHEDKLLKYGVEQSLEDDDIGFLTDHTEDGDTYCLNYNVWVPMPLLGDKLCLQLLSRLNSKEAFPLYCMTFDYDMIPVFTDEGKITKEFKAYLKRINEYNG